MQATELEQMKIQTPLGDLCLTLLMKKKAEALDLRLALFGKEKHKTMEWCQHQTAERQER